MHNRVRMVVASFLIKDLHIGWWHGADWFMEHLRDGDIAQNQLNWQWVAGCGTDAGTVLPDLQPDHPGARSSTATGPTSDATSPSSPTCRSSTCTPLGGGRRRAGRISGADRRSRDRAPGGPRPLRQHPLIALNAP